MNPLFSIVEKELAGRLPHLAHQLLGEVFADGRHVRRKSLNLLLNAFEQKRKRTTLLSYPYYLLMDPTNICSLKCPLCPTWRDTAGRPKGKMDLTRYFRLMDEAGPYLFAVGLHNWGEPLLHPGLPEMIRYAKKFNMPLLSGWTMTGLWMLSEYSAAFVKTLLSRGRSLMSVFI